MKIRQPKKIRTDEHVSPRIPEIIRDIFLSCQNFELSSIHEAGDDGSDDCSWIRKFADEGGFAIISADTDFFKKPQQIIAVESTGLRVIYLPPKYANAEMYHQVAHISMWWPAIESKLSTANPREFWETPWKITPNLELKCKNINFREAHKKHKKATRPARTGRTRGPQEITD